MPKSGVQISPRPFFLIKINMHWNWVSVLHLLFVVVFVAVPFFVNNPFILCVHVLVGLGMIMHWIIRNDLCCLTLLEHKMFGTPIDQTYLQRLLGPVFSVDKKAVQWAAVFLILVSFGRMVFQFRCLFKGEWSPKK